MTHPSISLEEKDTDQFAFIATTLEEKSIDASILANTQIKDVNDIDPSILISAYEIATCTNEKEQNHLKKIFLEPLKQRQVLLNFKIERYSALYHAFKNSNDDKYREYENIINLAIKKENIPKQINTFVLNTLSSKDPIPKNHKQKFLCVANTQNDQLKKLYKDKINLTSVNKENHQKIKEIKKRLKAHLLHTTKLSIETKSELFSKITIKELEIQSMLKYFQSLKDEIEKLPMVITDEETKENLQTIIDKLCDLMDSNFGDDTIFETKYKPKKIYLECAQGNIYKNSTESKIKKPNNSSFNPEIRQPTEKYINKVIKFIENQLKIEKKRIKDEEEYISSILDDNSSAEIYNYFKKQISAHKKLSYNRFVNLFQIHSRFINRLNLAISFLGDNEKRSVQEIFYEAVSPKNLLQETTKHRYCQGRHLSKNQDSERKHQNLAKLNPLIKLITLDSTENFVAFECAHVVPSPGLFYRRGKEQSSLAKHHVSLSYFELDDEQKEEKVKQDITSISLKYKDNIDEYANHVLDLIFRLASEECASTMHLPSFFNQEIDGVSEKYIELNDVDWNTQELFLKFQKDLESQNNTIPYTKKLYKHLHANAIESMVSACKTFNYGEVCEVEKNYLIATKYAIAKKINQLVQKDLSVTNIITACALINVFKAIKNAEAKAEREIIDNDDIVLKGIQNIDKWLLNDVEISKVIYKKNSSVLF